MQLVFPDLGPAMAEIVMTVLAIVILLLDLVIKRKSVLAFISIIGLAAVGAVLLNCSGETFNNMFVSDCYSVFFKIIFIICGILTVLISVRYIEIERVNTGEYYSLILFSTIGMMLMASAKDLIVLYLGLELMALSTYVLAGFLSHDVKSNEASMKYFLLGAFSSGFLLYGIAMIYGLTRTTDMNAVTAYIVQNGLASNPVLLISLIMFVVAFSFKIAAVPFHMWAPDVYEGSPTSITAFMSVGPKAAGFAVIGRVLIEMLGSVKTEWTSLLIPLAVITMAVGNIAALAQKNIKRMLAYSSIAHTGYALLGIIAGKGEGMASVMNYILIYAFMNMGAFAVVIMLRSEGFKGDEISDYAGLAKKHPLVAAVMLIFMFSLTGIPPTAGFMAKFYIFMSAVNAGYTWLAVIAVVFSVISAYFYLRIVMYMYMKERDREIYLAVSPGMVLALAITAGAVLILGIFPSGFVDIARLSVAAF